MKENNEAMTEKEQAQALAEETLKTLKAIERQGKKQTAYMCICAASTIAVVVLSIAAIIAGVIAYQKMETAMEEVMVEVEAFSAQFEEIDIAGMTDDIAGMIENIDGLVDESRDSIGAATDTMLEMDMDTLNDAISDLQSVIEPLATFFSMF